MKWFSRNILCLLHYKTGISKQQPIACLYFIFLLFFFFFHREMTVFWSPYNSYSFCFLAWTPDQGTFFNFCFFFYFIVLSKSLQLPTLSHASVCKLHSCTGMRGDFPLNYFSFILLSLLQPFSFVQMKLEKKWKHPMKYQISYLSFCFKKQTCGLEVLACGYTSLLLFSY